jgi:hypothetical protein
MTQKLYLPGAILFVLPQTIHANAATFNATIIGGGTCTLEVNVDGSAEVEIRGDTAELRTVSGQETLWRRFQCTAPMPHAPVDFRFVGVDGRGFAGLLRDPRSNNGRAVVRIDDPPGCRAGYTFELRWGGPAGPGWPPTPPPGRGPGQGFQIARTIQACQEAVTVRLNQSGFPTVMFGVSVPENYPGGQGWVRVPRPDGGDSAAPCSRSPVRWTLIPDECNPRMCSVSSGPICQA